MDEQLECEVAVLGAGICGLNAAFVAAQYLRPGQRLVVIDRREGPGGMWQDAYPYVRLHQPHPLFTVGDLPWSLKAPPEHLASREEVVDHLQDCLRAVRGLADVTELFGHEYVDHEEDGAGVTIRLLAPDGRGVVLRAARLVKAIGFEIQMRPPLDLTSNEVRSTAPSLLQPGCEVLTDDAPVWVIGSGKTAMDTVLHLIEQNPGRVLNMVTGTGTYFSAREKVLPVGAARWWSGFRLNRTIMEVARRFDGTNAEDVARWFRRRVGTSPFAEARHNVFGVLADSESARVRGSLTETVRDHLVDVVDEAAGPVLLLRSGARHPVARGSWIVSCLGHFAAKDRVYEPYVSEGGRVVSINSSSVTFGFSSFSAYYLTHLLMRDLLEAAPLAEVDWDAVQTRAQAEATPILATVLVHNLSVALDLLGSRVFGSCGLDFDRWYPPHRMLAGQLDFALRHRRDREHALRVMSVVRERHGVRCGPRGRGAQAAAST